MKHTGYYILTLFLLFLYSNISFAQLKYLEGVQELPPHPRILLLKGEEEKIKKALNNPIWDKMHRDIIDECDDIIDLPVEKRVVLGAQQRLLATSREVLRRVFGLSYAYRMTGDEKYFYRAEKEMLEVAKFKDWNPVHFLDVGEMTLALAIGYDWLYDRLSSESRLIISDAILTKGISPTFDPVNAWFYNANHNWNQVCNTGISIGALATYENNPHLSQYIINRALETIPKPMEEYSPDGAYPEGYMYWTYGTTFNALFIDVMEKAFRTGFKLTSVPGFMETSDYYKNMIAPSGYPYNYYDCRLETTLNPTMFWFANKLKDPSLLWFEQVYLKTNKKDIKDRLFPIIMIWGINADVNNIPTPTNKIWTGRGTNPVSLMRTSWTDPNAIFVGFKGGKAKNNHGHMDAGSFIIEVDGVRWAMDAPLQEYSSLENGGWDIWDKSQNSDRWHILRYSNYLHNTLTVDSLLHRVDGYAPIVSSTGKDNFLSTTVDLSAVFRGQIGSAKRGISIIDQKYIYIKDEVTGLNEKNVTVRWTLLTQANVRITGKNSIELKKNGKKLDIIIPEPADIKIRTWSTKPSYKYEEQVEGSILVGFEFNLPANSSKDISVFMLPRGAKYDRKVMSKKLDQWKD